MTLRELKSELRRYTIDFKSSGTSGPVVQGDFINKRLEIELERADQHVKLAFSSFTGSRGGKKKLCATPANIVGSWEFKSKSGLGGKRLKFVRLRAGDIVTRKPMIFRGDSRSVAALQDAAFGFEKWHRTAPLRSRDINRWVRGNWISGVLIGQKYNRPLQSESWGSHRWISQCYHIFWSASPYPPPPRMLPKRSKTSYAPISTGVQKWLQMIKWELPSVTQIDRVNEISMVSKFT